MEEVEEFAKKLSIETHLGYTHCLSIVQYIYLNVRSLTRAKEMYELGSIRDLEVYCEVLRLMY
jgi:hypothetical protein